MKKNWQLKSIMIEKEKKKNWRDSNAELIGQNKESVNLKIEQGK